MKHNGKMKCLFSRRKRRQAIAVNLKVFEKLGEKKKKKIDNRKESEQPDCATLLMCVKGLGVRQQHGSTLADFKALNMLYTCQYFRVCVVRVGT